MPNKARYWRGRAAKALQLLEQYPDMDAVQVYRIAFGTENLSLWGFDPWLPRAAALLLQAVRRGRPFRHDWTLSRLCGGYRNTPPPELNL